MNAIQLWNVLEKAREKVYGGRVLPWHYLDDKTKEVYKLAAKELRDEQ